MLSSKDLDTKIKIKACLVFDTSFHIGSGNEGEMATDMGVLLEQDSGLPILPGSSLKGKFRSLAERLATHLGLSACLLDSGLSGTNCVTDESYRNSAPSGQKKKLMESFQELKNEKQKLNWLDNHVCSVCKLFGSPLHAGRIFFNDGLLNTWSGSVEIRDGVCLDRDSETARNGMKYDFEVVPAGTEFTLIMEVINHTQEELALIGAVLAEWENGVHIGGKTSRGLGAAHLQDIQISQVNYHDNKQLRNYLLHKKMTPSPEILTNALEETLQAQGVVNA